MTYRDGILRKRREHARGRNLADCGRICGSPRKSFGSIKEMINNMDNFVEETLIIPQCGKQLGIFKVGTI